MGGCSTDSGVEGGAGNAKSEEASQWQSWEST